VDWNWALVAKKIFLIYPCGKKFELRVPIPMAGDDGRVTSILPGADNYFEAAKKRFELNSLKVIEEEAPDKKPDKIQEFISLSHKIRSVE
jgi:hypothetical protein